MTDPRATTSPVDPILGVEHLDPATLLIDVNVRADATPDRTLVDSVRGLGVLVPVVAVRTDDGVRVRFGHRRTLAAIEAKLDTIPVWIISGDNTGGDADRIVRQWAENEHRAGLNQADRVKAVEQLAAFGVSAAQITKRLRTKRADVDTVLTVSASPLAKAATARYDFLTLDQAAVLAEFDTTDDNDKQTVIALVAAAKQTPARFPHIAQRARDERADRAKAAAMRQQVQATGLTLIEGENPTHWTYSGPARALKHLADADGKPLTITGHATCPGHAVYLGLHHAYWTEDERATLLLDTDPEPITDQTTNDQATGDRHDAEPTDVDADDEDDEDDEDAPYDDDEDPDDGEPRTWSPRWVGTFCCTDPTAHGHTDTRPARTTSTGAKAREEMTDAEREELRLAKRRVIDNNKAWASAETVRLDWLKTWLTRKTAPKTSAAFIATALAYDGSIVADVGGNALAANLLGLTATGYGRNSDLATLITQASDARAQVLALAQVLAAYEARTSREDWRTISAANVRYLGYLADLGYGLSDVEHLACGQDPLPHDADDKPDNDDATNNVRTDQDDQGQAVA